MEYKMLPASDIIPYQYTLESSSIEYLHRVRHRYIHCILKFTVNMIRLPFPMDVVAFTI